MPADTLLDLPREKYRWRLQLAKDAGIQLIRIWGPGLQEAEEFYDCCDEMGCLGMGPDGDRGRLLALVGDDGSCGLTSVVRWSVFP